jgi:hypothetical protein
VSPRHRRQLARTHNEDALLAGDTDGVKPVRMPSRKAPLAGRTWHLGVASALPGISPTSWDRMSKSAARALTKPVTESPGRESNHINTIDDPSRPQTEDSG